MKNIMAAILVLLIVYDTLAQSVSRPDTAFLPISIEQDTDSNYSEGKETRIYPFDYDNDNDIDILAGNAHRDSLENVIWQNFWYINDGFGNFIKQEDTSININLERVCSADVNADGFQDLITTDPGKVFILCYVNDGFGKYSFQDSIQCFSLGIDWLKALDIDCDQDMDILCSRTDRASRILWYENNGIGEFDEGQTIVARIENGGESITDFDNDGDMDVLAYNDEYVTPDDSSEYIAFDINLVENFTGTFDERKLLSKLYSMTDIGLHFDLIMAGDINNNGHSDILVSYTDTITKVEYFPSNDSEFANSHVIIQTEEEFEHVLLEDYDKDKDVDLVAIPKSCNKIVWYENYGNGHFSNEQIIDYTIDRINSVYNIDINGDDTLDLLIATADTIKWFKNIGTKTIHDTISCDNSDTLQSYFILEENFKQPLRISPNPLAENTIVYYCLPVKSEVELSIYSITGQKMHTLVSDMQNAGNYQVEWNTVNCKNGIYFCKLSRNNMNTVKKVIVAK